MPVLYLWNHSFALSTSSEPFSRHAWQIIAPAACRLLACFTSLVEHPCSIFRARIYKKREKKRKKKKKNSVLLAFHSLTTKSTSIPPDRCTRGSPNICLAVTLSSQGYLPHLLAVVLFSFLFLRLFFLTSFSSPLHNLFMTRHFMPTSFMTKTHKHLQKRPLALQDLVQLLEPHRFGEQQINAARKRLLLRAR